MTSTIAQLTECIAPQLLAVDALFARELNSDLACVNTLVKHVSRFRGKMLRPMLVLLAGKSCGELSDAHVTLATVVEMVHMATLVHDDVLDDAELRRKGATINHLRGNEAAVLLGDYLISHSYHLCSSLDSQFASRTIGRTTNQVCEGELLQIDNRNNLDLDEQTYLQIITRKTASLCATCCVLGAKFAGASEQQIRRLETYGLSLGTAFQIQDDILDLVGEVETVGKTLGSDIEKGKMTLPMIHFLRTAPAEHRMLLRSLLQSRDADKVERIRNLLLPSDSIQYAQERARQLVLRAREAIGELPETEARRVLDTMAEFVIQRAMRGRDERCVKTGVPLFTHHSSRITHRIPDLPQPPPAPYHSRMLGRGIIGAAVVIYIGVLGCVVWPENAATTAKSAASPVGSRAGTFEGLPLRGAGMQIQRTDWIDKYKKSMDEIAAAGFDTVELVVDTRMENGTSTRIFLDMRMTPTPEKLGELIQHAKSLKLRVILMPIVLLDNPQGNEWRGTLRPNSDNGGWDDWFDSYRNMITYYAWIAESNKADVLVIGSELVSAENKADQWEKTIKAVRGVFHGHITYSANWDHYTAIPFWDQLDMIGLNSYWAMDLVPPDSHNHKKSKVTVEEIEANWKYIQKDLLEFQAKTGKPLLFTEVGWFSAANTANEPWDYTQADEPIDMDLQKRLYEAFFRSWHGKPGLGGFTIWEWTPGDGGKGYEGREPADTPEDILLGWRGYTPENKPAEQVLKEWLAKPWK